MLTQNQKGRDIIYTGSNKDLLGQIANEINRTRLDVTVQSHYFTLQETVVGNCLKWLYELLSRVTTSPVQIDDFEYQAAEPIVRLTICDVFCQPPMLPIAKMEDRYHLGPEGPPNVFEVSSSPTRLDFMLLYDVKMWKSLRKTLHELIISTLIVSGDAYKIVLAERFAICYPKLVELAITIDREVDLSITSLSVQLFTVPTIARHLALDTTLINEMLLFLYTLFQSGSRREKVTRSHLYQAKRIVDDEMSNSPQVLPSTLLPSSSYALKHSRTYARVVHDMGFLLSTKAVRLELFQSNAPPKVEFWRILKLLAVGQCIDPQTRAITDHVEFEADDWVNAFNLSLNLSQLMPYVAGCFAPFDRADSALLESALAQISSVLITPVAQRPVTWTFLRSDGEFGLYIMPKYQVSTRPVSLHHPLHWLLGMMIAYLPLSTKNCKVDLFEVLTRYFPPTDGLFYAVAIGSDTVRITKVEILSLLFEEPLRTFAMLSQIQAGLWVRNGYMLRAQAHHYEELELREDGHDQDILLLQAAAVTLGPDRFLLQALHRFELWDWLIVRQRTITPTGFDLTKLGVITEGFLNMLIILLTERALCSMGLAEVSPESEIRREMIHHLGAAAHGLPHSAVITKLPDRLMDPHDLNDGCK